MLPPTRSILLLLLAFLPIASSAQKPKLMPVPPPPSAVSTPEPTDPPARDIKDLRDRLTLHLPAGWNLATRDGEVSTFRLDAPTAPRTSQLRYVASIAFNPFPQSTFSGALLYISSAPHLSDAACAAQTTTKPFTKLDPVTIDGVPFARGKNERGGICTESRTVAYTALRQGACLRLDVVLNTFCGGDVSGAQEVTRDQLGNIYQRLDGIVQSIRFTR